MKVALIIITLALPALANAYTFCYNTVNNHGGLNFYASPDDECPTRIGGVYQQFRYYKVEKSRHCKLETARTRTTGDQLLCYSKWTLKQIEEVTASREILRNNGKLKEWLANARLVESSMMVKQVRDERNAQVDNQQGGTNEQQDGEPYAVTPTSQMPKLADPAAATPE